MRYLVAESVSLKPHLETAGEVALQAVNDGHEATFAWLGDDLPWSDWNLPAIARWIGCSLKRRERQFERLLSENGVTVVDHAPDDAAWARQIADWPEAFAGDLTDLKNYTYDGAPLGVGVASTLISYTGNARYDPRADIKRTRACLASALLVYLRAVRMIDACKPDLLVTFNGRFATTRPIVAAVEKAGVTILRHERGWTYTHYELFSDAIHNFSYIRRRVQQAWEVAEPQQRAEAGHAFFRRRRGGEGIGWYSFTADQETGRIPARVAGMRRLVYFSSSDDEYAAVADAYEPGPWPDQFSAVQDLISVRKDFPDIEFIIRVHPHLLKKSAEERSHWEGLAEPGVDVIGPGETVDSYALINSADIVASYGSTIGLEAAYWGKPSVLLGPITYRGSGAVLEPQDKQAIRALLDPANPPPAPAQEICLPFGHYLMTYGRPFRYYLPESLSEGRLLGRRLGWDPWWVYHLRRMRVGQLYRKLTGALTTK